MGRPENECRRVAQSLARRLDLSLAPACLGAGHDGIVFAAAREGWPATVAIKVHEDAKCFRREIDVYRRLRDIDVARIAGCAVPRLIASDDQGFAITMTIVSRPYVLDFAGAWLDEPPDFSEEALEEWEKEKAELFEEDELQKVENILAQFRAMGIYIFDANPGNIAL